MNTAIMYLAISVALAFVLYYIFPLRYRWTVLLAVSILFYLLTSTYMFVFVLTTAIGVYFGARAMEKRNMRLAAALEQVKQSKRAELAAECATVAPATGGGYDLFMYRPRKTEKIG